MQTAKDHQLRAELDRLEMHLTEHADVLSGLGVVAIGSGFAGLVSAGILRPDYQKAIVQCIIYAAGTAKYLSRQRENEDG